MNKTTRYVMVTGANGGVGQAICQEFVANGYQVLATDQQSEAARGLHCYRYLPLDLQTFVNDEVVAETFLDKIKNEAQDGQLHALINNAAIQILGSVDDLSRNDWQTTLNINLTAPFLLSQGLLALLEQAKGSIVNISSIHAKLTKKNFVAYATSKAALSGMTRAMAVDLGARVRVNAIEPAAIATKMLKDGFEFQPDKYNELKKFHPSESIGEPSAVARLVIFLTGKDTDFIHGCCVGIDGAINNVLHDPQE